MNQEFYTQQHWLLHIKSIEKAVNTQEHGNLIVMRLFFFLKNSPKHKLHSGKR